MEDKKTVDGVDRLVARTEKCMGGELSNSSEPAPHKISAGLTRVGLRARGHDSCHATRSGNDGALSGDLWYMSTKRNHQMKNAGGGQSGTPARTATARLPSQISTSGPRLKASTFASACASVSDTMTVAGAVMWPAGLIEYTRYTGILRLKAGPQHLSVAEHRSYRRR